MEAVETKALQTFQNPPIMWKRYVDDTFVIVKKNNLKTFHEHLNNIEANIKFTLEIESNNSLPFLDVLVVKATKLYQKPTLTNRFLNFNSQHSFKPKAWDNIHFIPQNQLETNNKKKKKQINQ